MTLHTAIHKARLARDLSIRDAWLETGHLSAWGQGVTVTERTIRSVEVDAVPDRKTMRALAFVYRDDGLLRVWDTTMARRAADLEYFRNNSTTRMGAA